MRYRYSAFFPFYVLTNEEYVILHNTKERTRPISQCLHVGHLTSIANIYIKDVSFFLSTLSCYNEEGEKAC